MPLEKKIAHTNENYPLMVKETNLQSYYKK